MPGSVEFCKEDLEYCFRLLVLCMVLIQAGQRVSQSWYGPVVERLPTAKAPMALRLVKAACDQMPA